MGKNRRILAIDFGLKRIGLALTDEKKIIASPFKTIETQKNHEKTIEVLLLALKGYEIEKIIIGMPFKLNGQKGTIFDEVNLFISKLKEKTDIPIVPLDERFTTTIAENALREAEMNRKQRSKVIDSVAAAILLESYLATHTS